MKQLQSTMSFLLVTIAAVIGCDVMRPDDEGNTIPVKQQPLEVSRTKDDSTELLRIDLDDPEAALVLLFPEVFTRERKLHDIPKSSAQIQIFFFLIKIFSF